MDPFALFQVEERVWQCTASLDSRYHALQKIFHPDQWNSIAQDKALVFSSAITEAYRVLCDPVMRAQHILKNKALWPVPAFPEILEMCLSQDVPMTADDTMKAMDAAFDRKDHIEAQRLFWILSHVVKKENSARV